MLIDTKYSIGDKVLVMVDRKVKKICPFCNGKSKVELDNQILYCQNCEDGEIIYRPYERVKAEGIITGLNYNIRTEYEEVTISDYPDERTRAKLVHEVEYYVDVDENKYFGNGTYSEDKILEKL